MLKFLAMNSIRCKSHRGTDAEAAAARRFEIASGELSKSMASSGTQTPYPSPNPLEGAEHGSGGKFQGKEEVCVIHDEAQQKEGQDKDLPAVLRDIERQEDRETWAKYKADM